MAPLVSGAVREPSGPKKSAGTQPFAVLRQAVVLVALVLALFLLNLRATLLVLLAIDRLVGLRVDESTEADGLDIVEHGEAVA